MKRASAILSVILLAATTIGAALILCPDCGTECGPDDKTCPHCGRALPERKAVEDVADASATGPKDPVAGALLSGAVQADIASAEAAMKAGTSDVDLARLFLANASALLLLAGDKLPNLVDRVAALTKACDLATRSGWSQCPACGGTGKAYFYVKTLTGETNAQPVAGQVCSACQGLGKVARRLTVAEELAARAQAWRLFESEQKMRRRTALGRAWIPAEMDGLLGDRDVALIRRAVPPACAKCGGVGRLECRTCHGVGTLPCSNKGCVRGRVEVKFEGLSGTTLSRFEKCPTCGGTSVIKCPACGGTGGAICPSCQGDGKAPLCKKCGGQGTIVCSKCSGTGISRGEPCQACGGDGVTLCQTCHGDGRK